MAGRAFASDNWAGAHPEVLAALVAANDGHAPAYGEGDPYTARAEERFREVFGPDPRTFFVLTGTGANVLALGSLLRPHEAAICPAEAHVNVNECGAPERFLGSKLLPVPAPDGKLTPALVESRARRLRHPAPGAAARDLDLAGDRARHASTRSRRRGRSPTGRTSRPAGAHGRRPDRQRRGRARRLTARGDPRRRINVLSFGGTKNGVLAAEAVVFFDPVLAEGFEYTRKQGLQLASKQRFVAVQLEALLEGELWRRTPSTRTRWRSAWSRRFATSPGSSSCSPSRRTPCSLACRPGRFRGGRPLPVLRPRRAHAPRPADDVVGHVRERRGRARRRVRCGPGGVAGRTRPATGEPPGMVTYVVRRWRRRATLRAWAKGELEFAGALGRSHRRRSLRRPEPRRGEDGSRRPLALGHGGRDRIQARARTWREPAASTTSRSRSSAATGSRCPGETAPARRRCCGYWRARTPHGGELAIEKGARVALHDQRPPRARDSALRDYVLSGAADLVAIERGAAGGSSRRWPSATHGPGDARRYAAAQARLEHAGG